MRFDEDTSERRDANLIELRKPARARQTKARARQTKARAIATNILLGVIAWLAVIGLGLAIWRWIAV
jgi:hypothetical protein